MFIQKLLFKVVLMLGGLFGVLLFLPGPGGKPMMSLEDLPGFGLFKTATALVEDAGEAMDSATGENQVYQWVDENGTLHFSDVPVEGATSKEIVMGNDPIPSENFTGSAIKKKKSVFSKPKAFLIGDSSAGKNSIPGGANQAIQKGDFEALADGDYGNARQILDQLPEYLEKAHTDRMQALEP